MIRPSNNGKYELSRNDRVSRAAGKKRLPTDVRRREVELIAAPPEPRVRVIEPTLNVFVGSSAAAVGSRYKKLAIDQGTISLVANVALDSDAMTQSGASGCPSFSDEEFVHLKTDRVKNIVQNPEAHRKIIEQVGLDHPENADFIGRLLNEGLDQAGQVREFGYLAYLVNFAAVKKAIKNALAKLNGTHTALRTQLESDNRVVVNRRLNINIVFSNCGGTGSSMVIAVTSTVRELTKSLPIEVTGIMIMPSTFDSVMDGKPEEQVRLGANAAATIREIHAAQTGVLARHRVQIGPDERDQVPVPAGLFNQLFVVGRETADGLDLLSSEAVFDSIALYLAALAGTEISDRIAVEDANQASLRGLTPDPVTGLPRYISSLSAQGLVLPVERMSRRFTAWQVSEFIERCVVGGGAEASAIDSLIEDWMARPLSGEGTVIDARELPAMLQRCSLPNPATLLRPLYRAVRGNERVHYRNSPFVQACLRAQAAFKETQLPGVESELTATVTSLGEELKAAFRKQIGQIAKSLGWQAAKTYAAGLEGRLKGIATELSAGAESDLAVSRSAANQLKEAIVPLQGRLRGWLTSGKRQDLCASHYQTAVVAAVRHLSKAAANRVVNGLIAELLKHQQVADRTLAGAKRHLERLRVEGEEARTGKRLTTHSLVELDVSTDATDRKLYDQLRIAPSELAEKLRNDLNCPLAAATRQVMVDTESFNTLVEQVRQAFVSRLASVSVVDVIAEQLADESSAETMKAIIFQGVTGCQPMWRAESGQANIEFADSMIIGVPECPSESKRDRVVSALMSAASHRIHANGQYNGNASEVTSGDTHRIYIVRRVHGGSFHYLPDVVRAQTDYDQWTRHGGHPVHIFGPRIALPSVLPLADVDDGTFEFAVGLAAGWIANRGPYWYWNLEPVSGGEGKFACRLTSHWDGLGYVGMKRVEGNCLDALVRCGDVVYEADDAATPGQRIGESLAEARESVVHNGEMIEIIRELFDRLRVAAGDHRVATELDQYVTSLRRRARTGDAHYALIGEMGDSLAREIDRIRRHQPNRRR